MEKILVIDDDLTIVALVKNMLEDEQYTVITASDGQEGLEKVASENPDLIIVDVMMPNLDGASVVRALKSKTSTEKIPVIFITAMLSNEDESEGLLPINIDGQFFPAFAKPFKPTDFLSTIRDQLQTRT